MVDSMEIGLTDEDLPNERSDDVDNAISGIPDNPDRPQVVTVPNVLVTTSSNLFNDQETLRATRIIIHDPSTLNVLNGTQTITFNPLNRSLSVPEKNFNWDPSVYDPVLPVRCRNVKGELHKSRFGSGSRGRSILVNGQWSTPSEFEALCGRGSSKDWKRSIRYAGRTLMCLIDEGILRPHATSCTCGTCCDESPADSPSYPSVTTTGPVRLFTPYKRRKRQYHPKLKVSTNVANLDVSNADRMNISNGKKENIYCLESYAVLRKDFKPLMNIVSAPVELQTTDDLSTNVSSSESKSFDGSFVSTETTTTVIPESVIVTPAATPQTPRCAPTALDFSEQKQWWQLEEMVKNAVRHVLELQKQVETVKNESSAAREATLKQLRIQMENEKKEALNACRLEAQVSLSKAILEAKIEKEAAVEKAVQQVRLEMQEKFQAMVVDKTESFKRCANCDRDAFSECTGCHRVSYCSSFCQSKDWQLHRDECGDPMLSNDDCSDIVNDCDDPAS